MALSLKISLSVSCAPKCASVAACRRPAVVAFSETRKPAVLRSSYHFAGSSQQASTQLFGHQKAIINRRSGAAFAGWVLEPAGDGDSSHLDTKTPLPSPITVDFDVALVGRVPERADIVLPVATVSGCHAKLENKNGKLFVTDLESTNGTYVGNRKLRPGVATALDEGKLVIFGDEHLAQFRLKAVVDVEE
eukprot:TRINITY_DN196_c0_g1_i6.p1 TRINITY_DN196_c0_g1~~TRINITY_DN196_c0_g1_i6.p1  ORF type:complete len:207 (+),score=27.37 TRINITY_DN196_c0_g1_i6:50-622(+)